MKRLKRGDLVQHIYDEDIVVYQIVSDVPDVPVPPPNTALLRTRRVWAPERMWTPHPIVFDSEYTNLVPANPLLVIALAAQG